MTKKQNEHYVNNKEFAQAVAEHNEAVKLAESKGETPPRMSDYIGNASTRLQLVYLLDPTSLIILTETK